MGADEITAHRQLQLLARGAVAEEDSPLAVEHHDAVRHAAKHGLELGPLRFGARKLGAHLAGELDQMLFERAELVLPCRARRVPTAGENLARQRSMR